MRAVLCGTTAHTIFFYLIHSSSQCKQSHWRTRTKRQLLLWLCYTARKQKQRLRSIGEHCSFKIPLNRTTGNCFRSGIHTDILLIEKFLAVFIHFYSHAWQRILQYRTPTRRHAAAFWCVCLFLINPAPQPRLTAHASTTFTAACGKTK